tara:strand:- start:28970 stop:29152 length:183 start_codon:yes stop_codon:yes gene_type:complete
MVSPSFTHTGVCTKMSWLKIIGTILLGTVLIVGVVALTYYQWSDCLEENSFFTCARMLNK